MNKKYRFIGIRPFEFSEKDIFFERDNIVTKIIDTVNTKPITVVHSKAGYGKTSVIKAGLMPRLKNSSQYKIIYTSFPNFFKNSEASPIKVLNDNINKIQVSFSFWDKLEILVDDIWYKLKKISTVEDKTILLIFDQFENIFSFSEFEVNYFYEQIQNILAPIPEKLESIINYRIQQHEEELTVDTKNKILSQIDLKILITIRDDKLQKLKLFQKTINNELAKINIPAFTTKQAKNIFINTAAYKPKYNIDDNFESKAFEIGEQLLNQIILFLTDNGNKEIEPYQLQIIGRELEKITTRSLISKIDISHISNFDDLYNDYYEAVINKIKNPLQRMASRKFVEDELVFEYENRKLTVYQGVAINKYKISQETLDFLQKNNIIIQIKNNEETFYEISHDALITPILIAKQNRIKREIRLEEELRQKEFFKIQAQKEELKAKKTRNVAFLLATVLIIVGFLTIFAFHQRKIAIKNEKTAQSSMYATMAFQNLDNDPTLAFDYAEKSFKLQGANPLSVSALLNAFHKTGVFYSNVYNTGFDFISAVISHDAKKIAFVKYSDSSSQIVLTNDKAEVTNVWDISSIPSSIAFSNDDNLLFVSFYDKSITIYDLKNSKFQKLHLKNFVSHIAISPDNTHFLALSADNKVRIFRLNGQTEKTIKISGASLKYADFSNDGNKFVVSNADGNIMIYNLSGNLIAEYDYVFEFQMQTNDFQPVKFSKDDKEILIVVNDYYHTNFQIIVWNYEQNVVVAKIREFKSWINNASFVDSNSILASTKNGIAYLINYRTNNIKVLSGHKNEIFDAAMKGDTIITVSADNTIRNWKIYDVHSPIYDNAIVKFSNKGLYFAKKTNSKLIICSTVGDTVLSKNIDGIEKFEFSYDDKFLIFKYIDKMEIFDIVNNSQYIFQANENIIDFSVERKNLIVATATSLYKLNFFGKIIKKDKIKFKIEKQYLLWKDNLLIANENGIKILDIQGKKILNFNLKDIKKVKITNNKLLILTPYALYFTSNALDSLKEIHSGNTILDGGISLDGKYIFIVETKNKVSVWDCKANHLIDFKTKFPVFNTLFERNSLVIQYIDQNGQIKSVEKLISANQIIKFVDELKLYGDLYKAGVKTKPLTKQ